MIIENGKGIEVNTAGLKYGMSDPNPHHEIIKRYMELGGEIITIGSDAHNTDRVGDRVMESQKILKEIGFNGIYTFDQMKPKFHEFKF